MINRYFGIINANGNGNLLMVILFISVYFCPGSHAEGGRGGDYFERGSGSGRGIIKNEARP
jgi:hypothetical protein